MDRFNSFLAAMFNSASRVYTVVMLAVSLGLSLSLAPQIAMGVSNSYTDATLISSGQFLRELKEVAVTLAVDPWITKYVPEDELRADVTSALASYGITVHSNAPVSLLVTLRQLPSTIRETTIYSRGPNTVGDYRTHLFYYSMAFFVRAAALRDGKLHVLIAAPARFYSAFLVEEDNEVRKLFFGDEVRPDIKKELARIIPQSLEEIASRTTVDTTPWPVNGWTEKQKAAANTTYARIIKAQSAVEERPIAGLNTVPELSVSADTSSNPEACVADPSWENFWQAEFPRLGWVKTAVNPPTSIAHFLWCAFSGGTGSTFPAYYALWDDIELVESNLVFELNGRLVRKPAVTFSADRVTIAVPHEFSAKLEGYIPRSIREFVTNLTLGNQTVPSVAMASNPRPAVRAVKAQPLGAGTTEPAQPIEPSEPATPPEPPVDNHSMTPDDNPLGEGGIITPFQPPP